VHRYGIELEGLLYQDARLAKLRSQGKTGESVQVQVKYHAGDLSRIWVLDAEEERYMEVEAVNRTYTDGLSILINDRLACENEIKSLIILRVKITHLPGGIANAYTIHEAQDGTIQLSKETGGWSGARLAGILSQCHIATPMQTIFNGIITNDSATRGCTN
jgi:hypothetical protein